VLNTVYLFIVFGQMNTEAVTSDEVVDVIPSLEESAVTEPLVDTSAGVSLDSSLGSRFVKLIDSLATLAVIIPAEGEI